MAVLLLVSPSSESPEPVLANGRLKKSPEPVLANDRFSKQTVAKKFNGDV